MATILIKNGRVWNGNRIFNTEGYRCVLTVSDGQVVFRE